MVFPFTIRYSKELDKLSKEDIDKALIYLEGFIKEKSANKVIIEDGKLTYRASFWSWRSKTNILVTVEKGIFKISEKEDKSIVTYEFFMYHLLIPVIIISIILSAITKEYSSGLFCFLWLGGLNWGINLIRHDIMFDEICGEIDVMSIKPYTKVE
jgi:hypothetical protein